MSQWAWTTTEGLNNRLNTDDSLDIWRAARPALGRAHVHSTPLRRDVLEHDVDLDRAARIDLHLAAHEVPGKARREDVDVVLPRRHHHLERARPVGRAGGLYKARVPEVDGRADRGHTALVLDRALHDHASPQNEVELRITGPEADRIRLHPVVLAVPVLGDIAGLTGRDHADDVRRRARRHRIAAIKAAGAADAARRERGVHADEDVRHRFAGLVAHTTLDLRTARQVDVE